MNSDFKELLQSFAPHKVRYLVVGGNAAMHYSQPRYTKDLHLWLEASNDNATRVMAAFSSFGLPLLNVTPEDSSHESLQYMVGRFPVLFNFRTSLPGLDFAPCWERRLTDESEGFPVHYLSKPDLIHAKTLAGRPQDLPDLAEIGRTDQAVN